MSVHVGIRIKLAWVLEVLIITKLNGLSVACVTNVDLFVKLAGGSSHGRREQPWQEGAAMAGGSSHGRREQPWQEGAAMAGGSSHGRREQPWQEGNTKPN